MTPSLWITTTGFICFILGTCFGFAAYCPLDVPLRMSRLISKLLFSNIRLRLKLQLLDKDVRDKIEEFYKEEERRCSQ